MVANKTPLRLVAIEEAPPTEEEQEAAPVRVIAEHEAITRRVEGAAAIAAQDAPPEPRKRRLPSWQSIVPAGAAAGVLVAVAIGLLSKGKAPPSEPAGAAPPAAAKATKAPEQPQPAAAPPLPVVPVPGKAAASETIKLVVTAEPVEAVVSLDGNMLAGHRLNLEVPRDRGIHVVSASAPGYLPFNQQVSFSNDVVLKISLRRSRAPVVARPATRAVRPAPAPRVQAPVVRPPTFESRPALEPGMNLEGPAPRGNAKPIDERNPYAP